MDGAWRCHYCDPEAGFERVPTHLLQWYQNGTVLQKMQDMSMELAARLRSAGPKLGHDSIALRNEKFTRTHYQFVVRARMPTTRRFATVLATLLHYTPIRLKLGNCGLNQMILKEDFAHLLS